MGFQDLRQFNLAMLGKQGWRLLTNLNSLCAQVLKGKYFHDSDFLSARKKRNCPHTLGAILKGRTALEMGLIRRIGDGVSTNIWRIPEAPGNKPLFKKPEASAFVVLSKLISPDGN